MILILSGVYWLNNSKPMNLGANQCYLESEICEINLPEGQLQIEFPHFPIRVEEMTPVTLIFPKHYQLLDAHVEGTNMYMGKSPLINVRASIDRQQSHQQWEMFLGACSEPNMRWKLVLSFKNMASDESILANVYFQTHYN